MCKFKNYPDTFHDKWEYPTKSLYRFVHSSFHLFNAATKFISDHYSRHLYSLTFLGFIVIIVITLSTFLHIYFSSNFQLFIQFLPLISFFLLLILFICPQFSYKSNKDASIISIFLALLGVDRREKWPLCSFLSLMIVRTKR